jgi:peptidoglycan/LPS O-acetylase OafA/YrhL
MKIVFDLLRFLASISIVLFHYSPIRSGFIDHLNGVVSFFFILSGFLIKYSDSEGGNFNKSKFYIKRFIRILPLYWIVLFPYLFLSNTSVATKFIHLLLLQAWYIDSSVVLSLNSPAWFLSVLSFFYLLYPFFRNVNTWFLSLIQYSIFLVLIFFHERVNLYYFPIFHLQSFVFGLRLAETRRIWIGDVILSIFLISFSFYMNSNLLFHNGALYLFWGLIILLLLKSDFSMVSQFNFILRLLSKSSFAIYLLQAPLIILVLRIFGELDLASFIVYLGILIGTSVVYSLFFEDLITYRLNKIISRCFLCKK